MALIEITICSKSSPYPWVTILVIAEYYIHLNTQLKKPKHTNSREHNSSTLIKLHPVFGAFRFFPILAWVLELSDCTAFFVQVVQY